MSQIPPSSPPPPPGQGPSSRIKKAPNPAEITVLAGAGVVLIFSFLDFYSVSAGGFSSSINAWGSGLFPVSTLIVLFAAAAGVYVALGVFGTKTPDRVLTFTKTQLVLADGFFAAILALAFLLQDRGGFDLGIGYYFMLLGSIAVLVGGIMMFRESSNT